MQAVMSRIPGVADLGTFQVRGQPNVNLIVDRAAADRFGINVSDIQDAVETAVGGKAVSQILIGEQRYDLTVRYQPQFLRSVEDISNIRFLTPSGERVALASTLQNQARRRRLHYLQRRELALHRHQVQRARARLGQHRAPGD